MRKLKIWVAQSIHQLLAGLLSVGGWWMRLLRIKLWRQHRANKKLCRHRKPMPSFFIGGGQFERGEQGLGYFNGEAVWLLQLEQSAELSGCHWQSLRQFMLQADYPTFRMLAFAERIRARAGGDQPGDIHDVVHIGIGGYFQQRHIDAARSYYGLPENTGFCPPGLAKKGSGCLPPGQAKKWRPGAPLPAGVVVYDVPRSMVLSLGVPPSGYKYVRVASDILLIAIGSGMVVDAMEDLVR